MKNQNNPTAKTVKNGFVQRLVIGAMFAAVYVVLASFLSVDLGVMQVSFASFAIILGGLLLGMPDIILLSFCAAFLEQLLYGFSPTTVLWLLPTLIQGIFVGLCSYVPTQGKSHIKTAVQTIIIVALAELLLTGANIAALYLDANIMGYTVKALYAILPMRIANTAVRIVVNSVLVLLLLPKLRKITKAGKK